MNGKNMCPVIAALALAVITSLTTAGDAQAQAKTAQTEQAQADTAKAEENPLDYSRPVYTYDTGGKRDPFETLVPGSDDMRAEEKIKGLFNYERATLKGIVSSPDDRYALVTDADGFGYVLREGYRVFGGYVSKITDDAMHLHIVKYGRSLSIIMRLESSRSTVIVEESDGRSTIQKPGITIDYTKNGEAGSGLRVDEVAAPTLSTRTLEEQWFGTGEKETGSDAGSAAGDETTEVRVFSLIDPPDGTWIELPYVLDWTVCEGDSVSYTLVIDDNRDFSSPLVEKDAIVTSSHLVERDEALPVNTQLYWKVIARDGSGAETTCVRTDMSFKIIGNQ